MKLPITPEFDAEAARFRLVHHCEDCALFDEGRPPRERCAHGYPTEEHERARRSVSLVFCKEFEPT